MDHEEAVALDRDGQVLVAKQGSRSSVRFTDTEAMRMRRAAVFTHNHPGGRSFSPEDVAMACALEFEELRVVTTRWAHVLRLGPSGWSEEYWSLRLDDAVQRTFLAVADEFQEAIARRRLSAEEANADFWHRVWERVAESEGLDYSRFTGDRTDADRA